MAGKHKHSYIPGGLHGEYRLAGGVVVASFVIRHARAAGIDLCRRVVEIHVGGRGAVWLQVHDTVGVGAALLPGWLQTGRGPWVVGVALAAELGGDKGVVWPLAAVALPLDLRNGAGDKVLPRARPVDVGPLDERACGVAARPVVAIWVCPRVDDEKFIVPDDHGVVCVGLGARGVDDGFKVGRTVCRDDGGTLSYRVRTWCKT